MPVASRCGWALRSVAPPCVAQRKGAPNSLLAAVYVVEVLAVPILDPVAERIRIGPADAKTTLVEFFDYNCPYCRASVPAMKKFYEAHKKDTRFAFIEFPIKGENSEFASRAAIAARKQGGDKYLAFHFLMMDEHEMVTPDVVFADARKAGLDLGKLSADMKDPAVDKAIKAAHALAEKTGINATPTFILNGRVRPGAIDDKMLTQMLES